MIDPHFSARLAGACVTKLMRRGKYMIMRSDRGDSIIVHLGMSGRFVLADTDAALARHTHVIFHFPDGLQLRFVDPRRFSAIDLM
ncbi:MAG: DNA-formamidopyrimidine glycosylase family protein [Acetobacteraceae bacterium]